MVTAAKNSLAMLRFGAIRALHGAGGEFSLAVLGPALVGAVAWALFRTRRSGDTNG
jgi:hypothetical protein